MSACLSKCNNNETIHNHVTSTVEPILRIASDLSVTLPAFAAGRSAANPPVAFAAVNR